MDVTCPECRSVFRVDPAKVPPAGVRARCAVCGAVIPVHSGEVSQPQVESERFAPALAAPDRVLAATGTTSGATSVSTQRVLHTGADESAPPTPPAPVAASSAPPTLMGAPTSRPGLPTEVIGEVPPVDLQQQEAPPQPPEPPSEPVARITPVPSTPSVDPRPSQPRLAPRRVNPYLSNDPAQKARRLARALVSDLVAYNPQKREEGLRAGTLKELFRDEIRKSWQEYVEQVGATIAESTPHFQDALNDILAGGRRVF